MQNSSIYELCKPLHFCHVKIYFGYCMSGYSIIVQQLGGSLFPSFTKPQIFCFKTPRILKARTTP